jgi:LysR family transcriptional regulator, nitrogen assimilation regulatory protein
MPTLRQIRSFVAVFEEGSFTGAAKREGATQSGVSQHVRQLEDRLGIALFERDRRGVTPTLQGERYYQDCIAVLRQLDAAQAELSQANVPSGEVRAGLMPTFTRAVLAPALERIVSTAPSVDIRVTEAYSGVLTDLVRRGELDFAVVPGFQGAVGLKTTLLLRDPEMLVAAKGRVGAHLQPVRLGSLGPLKVVLPEAQNTRCGTLETYFTTNGVQITRRLHLDAMMGTLSFVAATDWVAILPRVMMANDLENDKYDIRPLKSPPLFSDFVMIELARRTLSPAARVFVEILREETARTVKLGVAPIRA